MKDNFLLVPVCSRKERRKERREKRKEKRKKRRKEKKRKENRNNVEGKKCTLNKQCVSPVEEETFL